MGDAFSSMTNAVSSASGHVDKVQAVLDQHVQSAKSLQSQAEGYYTDAKSKMDSAQATLDGHVDKAKSFSGQAKSALCGVISISSVCNETTAGVATSTGPAVMPTSCTGGSCCQQSSCYSNLVPGLKCDSDRGDTTCVGGSMFSQKKGVCQCEFGGACSAQGKCPTMAGTTRLFEDGMVVPKEDFTLPVLALLTFVGSTTVLGCIATSRRIRSWVRPTSTSKRQAFLPVECAEE